MAEDSQNSPATGSVFSRLRNWGTSSISPALLATLITALHVRPLNPMALILFPGPLLFSSYVNLAGYITGAAGISAAWSGVYVLLAMRRSRGLISKFSPRGLVRGASMGIGAANLMGGGLVYATGSFEKDEQERERRKRWSESS